MNSAAFDIVKSLIEKKKYDVITEYSHIVNPEKGDIIVTEYTGKGVRTYKDNAGITRVLCPKDIDVIQEGHVAQAIANGTIFDDADEVDRNATMIERTTLPYDAMINSGKDTPKQLKPMIAIIIGRMDDNGSFEVSDADRTNGENFVRDLCDKDKCEKVTDVVDNYLEKKPEDFYTPEMGKGITELDKEVDDICDTKPEDCVTDNDCCDSYDDYDMDAIESDPDNDPDDDSETSDDDEGDVPIEEYYSSFYDEQVYQEGVLKNIRKVIKLKYDPKTKTILTDVPVPGTTKSEKRRVHVQLGTYGTGSSFRYSDSGKFLFDPDTNNDIKKAKAKYGDDVVPEGMSIKIDLKDFLGDTDEFMHALKHEEGHMAIKCDPSRFKDDLIKSGRLTDRNRDKLKLNHHAMSREEYVADLYAARSAGIEGQRKFCKKYYESGKRSRDNIDKVFVKIDKLLKKLYYKLYKDKLTLEEKEKLVSDAKKEMDGGSLDNAIASLSNMIKLGVPRFDESYAEDSPEIKALFGEAREKAKKMEKLSKQIAKDIAVLSAKISETEFKHLATAIRDNLAANKRLCSEIMQEAKMRLAYVEKMVKESALVEGFDDISDELYMESKSRERDKTPRNEISQWMEKKGYWYTGDNPKKKKECNRMYHFLQQHKFDPKTETYESDIKLKDGSTKRMKLKFDLDSESLAFTEAEKKLLHKLVEQSETTNDDGKKIIDYIDLDFSDKRIITLLTKIQIRNDMMGGQNSFYDYSNDELVLSSRLLKGKQPAAQWLFKHEEGHANDYATRRGETSPDEKEKINRTKHDAGEFRYKQENKGLHMNPHDRQSTELYADSYGARNAKKRTKDGIKKFTDSDLKQALSVMSNIVTSKGGGISKQACIDRIDLLIKCIDDFMTDDLSIDGNFVVNIKHGSLIRSYLEQRDAADKATKYLIHNIQSLTDDDDKSKAKKMLNELERIEHNRIELKNHGLDPVSVDILIRSLDDLLEMGMTLQSLMDAAKESTNIDRIYKSIQDLKKTRSKSVGNPYWTPSINISADMIKRAAESRDGNSVNKMLDQIKAECEKLKKKLQKAKDVINKDYKDLEKFSDVSSAMRYEFSRRYVSESEISDIDALMIFIECVDTVEECGDSCKNEVVEEDAISSEAPTESTIVDGSVNKTPIPMSAQTKTLIATKPSMHQEGFLSRKPKKLKPIPRDTIAYITVEMNDIHSANDQAMLSGYTCSKIELVDFYLTVLDTQDARYIVPHSKQYLVQMKNDLERLLAQILKIRPINRSEQIWRVNYPS